jgi:hypothetical protein
MDRLRDAPPGHFFDVITNGFGAMNDYAAQLKPRDRWAIVAYIRALQLSQYINVRDLTAQDRQELEKGRDDAAILPFISHRVFCSGSALQPAACRC